MPELPPTRPDDRPLHEDVRRIASALGQVIERLEGAEAFEAVESLRRACRARRRGEDGAPDLAALREQVASLPLEVAAVVARAFTLFFLLINTCEQVHRVRRRRDYRDQPEVDPQPASPLWAMRRLQGAGHEVDEVAAALRDLHVRPVLTAHPTEATRRTVLDIQARVARHLLDRDQAPASERHLLDAQVETEVELLWLTSEVRSDRPSVLDEVGQVLWYLEDRLMDAATRVSTALEHAFESTFSAEAPDAAPLHMGNWVAGDRDGNPYVTPEVTLAATRRATFTVLRRYAATVQELIPKLSVSTRIAAAPEALRASLEHDRELLPAVWESNKRRDAEEPVRLKLTFIRARLEATRRQVAARDAGRPEPEGAAYARVDELLADLALVGEALDAADARQARQHLLEPLIRQVRLFGFHGFALDVREDSAVHTQALADVTRALGIDELDLQGLRQELLGRRPLIGEHLDLDEGTRQCLEVFQVIRQVQAEAGPTACETYIMSMTDSAEDLLRTLLLGRETGLVDLAADPPRSAIDVVPLFETRADLVNAPAIMRSLLGDPAWQRQMQARGHRQEIMIGYSDSAKDAGVLPAAWALYTAQEQLAAVFDEAGVELTLFHGRGGTVGRGGGSPVYRGLMALPPGTVDRRIKITEQGEVISQKFGLAPIAERSLEVMTTGTLVASFEDWREGVDPGAVGLYREIMEQLSDAALPVFRGLVHDDDRLFELFQRATPVRELANVHFGSRPAYREGGTGTMEGIRAIPWVFGWTQIRLMLPGWLGVGTALHQVISDAGGLEVLQRMVADWPFFDDLLGKVEMVCAKADLDIARAYVDHLDGDSELFDTLAEEYDRTVRAVLAIREHDALLDGNEVLQASIALRNPYVDPLSLLQMHLLQTKRQATAATEGLEEALGSTLNGVAQGLRNTG